MSDKLLIIGASGHGKVLAEIAIKMRKWNYIAFIDDNDNIKSAMNIDVIGKTTDVFKYIKDYDIFVGIGNNKIREQFQKRLENAGANIPILIHPKSVVSDSINIDVGTVIMAGTVINCCTFIGKGCIINTNVSIDHDNKIGDYVHISPGVHTAGTVKIGNGTWLGIGSAINNNIDIVGNCIIGAGAVVVKNIVEEGTYIGVPARKIEN